MRPGAKARRRRRAACQSVEKAAGARPKTPWFAHGSVAGARPYWRWARADRHQESSAPFGTRPPGRYRAAVDCVHEISPFCCERNGPPGEHTTGEPLTLGFVHGPLQAPKRSAAARCERDLQDCWQTQKAPESGALGAQGCSEITTATATAVAVTATAQLSRNPLRTRYAAAWKRLRKARTSSWLRWAPSAWRSTMARTLAGRDAFSALR